MKKEVTKTIRVSEKLHKKLASLGSKEETYEDIINRLIENQKQ